MRIRLTSPAAWYELHWHFQCELLREYIEGVEAQITRSVETFRSTKWEYTNGEVAFNPYVAPVTGHGILTDDTWNLEVVFEEYLPNLYRKSALMTLWSAFEHEVFELCRLCADVYTLAEGFPRRKEDGGPRNESLDTATEYLKSQAGLRIDKSRREWCQLDKIREVRNLIAHGGGKLMSVEERHRRKVKAHIAECDSPNYIDSRGNTEGPEVILGPRYLSYTLQKFREFVSHWGLRDVKT